MPSSAAINLRHRESAGHDPWPGSVTRCTCWHTRATGVDTKASPRRRRQFANVNETGRNDVTADLTAALRNVRNGHVPNAKK